MSSVGNIKKRRVSIEPPAAKHAKLSSETDNLDLDTKMWDDSFDIDFEKQIDIPLDLSRWTRCTVLSADKDPKTKDLVLKMKGNDGVGVCRLQGIWSHSKVTANEIVSILAQWNNAINSFVVSSQAGFFVSMPDYLVSGTSVVGSLFCQRRGVLSDHFRGIDCGNKIMTVGSLVHELLQTVLRKKLETTRQINEAATALIESRSIIATLYNSNMTVEEIGTEINKFIPKIVDFVQQYVTGDAPHSKLPNAFTGKIDRIKDIEENIWVPQIGLKGKVDVSVRVQRKNNFFDADIEEMPLELKTGRASFSSEHRGQIILYQMMMNEVGKKVKSGLLLYLREGIMQEISPNRNEQRDLIMLRNDLAYYLTRPIVITDDHKLGVLELPAPIHHHSACSTCPYNVICGVYATQEPPLAATHPLVAVSKTVIDHLTPDHIAYFVRWTGLLALDDEEQLKGNQMRRLWTDLPEERSKRGMCVTELKISGEIIEEDGSYLHAFISSKEPPKQDFSLCGMTTAEYVIVSSSSRIAVAAGRIVRINSSTIVVALERNLGDIYKKSYFHLDKHESQTFSTFNKTNLGALLDNNQIATNLRKIIIEKTPPTFIEKLEPAFIERGKHVLESLNEIQQEAVLKALRANEFLLLKGLPGTGKTQTIIALVRFLAILGKSVLITSHTHSAVDNVLAKLADHQIKFMRIGSISRVADVIRPYTEAVLTASCKSPDDLEKVYAKMNIVGVTCLGAAHPMLARRIFDVCIVDESTQVQQSTVLRPLMCAHKFILVGDPEQLPPIVKSNRARTLGADVSLFAHLDSIECTATLSLQYRMNRVIARLANNLTYHGSLQCANEQVACATLKLPYLDTLKDRYNCEKWLLKAVTPHLDQSVILLDTGNVFERNNNFAKNQKSDLSATVEKSSVERAYENKTKTLNTCINYCEAAVLLHVVEALVCGGCPCESIGIIAPYRAQVELIKQLIGKWQAQQKSGPSQYKYMDIEVNTVDQYQGRDKNVILYSCTKSHSSSDEKPRVNGGRETEILDDRRRLTVAITRSRNKLIMIGDESSLRTYSPFRDFLDGLSSLCQLRLVNERLGFKWESMLGKLKLIME